MLTAMFSDFINWFMNDFLDAFIDDVYVALFTVLALLLIVATLPLWIIPFILWLIAERRNNNGRKDL